jgi:hypothetical protein
MRADRKRDRVELSPGEYVSHFLLCLLLIYLSWLVGAEALSSAMNQAEQLTKSCRKRISPRSPPLSVVA